MSLVLSIPHIQTYPYDIPPLTVQEAASTAEAASQARFGWGTEYHPHLSARHSYSSSTRSAVPVPHHSSYDTFGYSASPGAFAPSSSVQHESLPSRSHINTGRFSLPGISTIDSPYETSYAPMYGNGSPLQRASDYASAAGVGAASGIHQDDYSLDSAPAVDDNISGPTRNTRTRHHQAPYAYTGSAAQRRVNEVVGGSSSRYPEPHSLPHSAYIDSLQSPPRRSGRSSRKAAPVAGVPLEKNFVCKTCT